jgi:hypothetical protein
MELTTALVNANGKGDEIPNRRLNVLVTTYFCLGPVPGAKVGPPVEAEPSSSDCLYDCMRPSHARQIRLDIFTDICDEKSDHAKMRQV